MENKIKILFSKKIIKYFIFGGLAAVIDIVILYIFVEILNIYYLLAVVLAFIISFIFGFLFQKYITFENFDKKYLNQGLLFLIFQLIGLLINLILLYIFVEIFGFYYMYVVIFNKIIIFLWNFTMNNYFNFK